ncbi:hypothetical protein M3Y98_00085100 [Aphelenchoides besseyi]|nr:hypothetical protein M3Y98_00085100 [Aphelenchoides besseyi]
MRREVKNMSKRTKEILSQFTNTLITRILLYGLTNILPLTISYLTMFFTINSTILDITSTITFIWFPTLNTVFLLLYIKAYRENIIQSFGLCFKGLSLQQSSQNSMTRVRSLAS